MNAFLAPARSHRGRELRALAEALLFLAPSLALFLVFVFVPLGRGVYLSLFRTNPIGNPTTFAGLDQYAQLFSSPAFRSSLVATSLFAIYSVPPAIVLALVLAILANRQLRGINAFRTLLTSTVA